MYDKTRAEGSAVHGGPSSGEEWLLLAGVEAVVELMWCPLLCLPPRSIGAQAV